MFFASSLFLLVVVSCTLGTNAESTSYVLPEANHVANTSYYQLIGNAKQKFDALNYLQQNGFASRWKECLIDYFNMGYEGLLRKSIQAMSPEKADNHLENRETSSETQSLESLMSILSDGNNVTSKCINDTARTIMSLFAGEGWAELMVDATGKPGPSLAELRVNWVGNYQQCRSIIAPPTPNKTDDGFKGNYCVLTVFAAVGPSNPIMLYGLPIQIGACLPNSCSEADLDAFLQNILELVKNQTIVKELRLHNPVAECRTDAREVTVATVLAVVLLCIIYGLVILGTAYDICFLQWPRWKSDMLQEDILVTHSHEVESKSNVNEHEENAGETSANEKTPLLVPGKNPSGQSSSGKLVQALLAFSAYTNGSKVLNTTKPPGSLNAVHGIRFLSMSWVILGHTLVFGLADFLNGSTALPAFLQRWTFDAIFNALNSVDTFFTLTGLLVSYLTIQEMMRKGWKINWAMFYFHRFWRLTPPYMFALLIVLGLQRFMGSGALWPTLQPMDKVFCEDNWWTNLLYVNNLVHTSKQCFAHAWYLANDMQFYFISPLMLIPFYFHRLLGFASCMVFLLVTYITTGVLSTQEKWADFMFSTSNTTAPFPTTFQHYYIVPWCRIGPFVVGVMAGYFLAVTKGAQIRMRWYVVALGWACAVATGLLCVYGIRGDLSGNDPSSIGVAALYNTMSRSAWGAAVCWVIIACAAGYGGPVNALLSWSPFIVLGRLSYMAYLIHPAIITIYYENAETLYYLNDTNLVITYLGILVFSYMTAFVLMLGLESPMIGLEKAFLRKSKRA